MLNLHPDDLLESKVYIMNFLNSGTTVVSSQFPTELMLLDFLQIRGLHCMGNIVVAICGCTGKP